MSIEDVVNSTITALTVFPTAPGFGTPLIAAYHTHWTDRLRYYPGPGGLAAMTADGFTVNDAAYKAATALLAQNPNVTQFAIGRRTLLTSQSVGFTFSDTTSGDVLSVTIVGSDGVSHLVTVTASGTPATDAAAFTTAVNAITGHATTIGTAATASATSTVSRTDGKLTDYQNWSPSIQLADTSADPGIATDLAAIYAVDPTGWYGLALDSNSKAEIEAAATWVEANGKIMACNNSDFANGTIGGTTDLFAQLKASAFARTYCQQNNVQLLCYAGAAMLGSRLPANPGSDTWAFKTLAGVPADTTATLPTTFVTALKQKNGNWYLTTANINVTFNGMSPSGEFMDVVRFVDWFNANLKVDVFGLIASLPKLPYTDAGEDALVNTVKTRIKIGGKAPYGGIDLTQPFTVSVPPVAQQTSANRAARIVDGLTWNARLSGAVHHVNLTGNLTV